MVNQQKISLFSTTEAAGVEEPGQHERQQRGRRLDDSSLRTSAGSRLHHYVLPEHRKLHPVHQGGQGSLAARRHAQHEAVHVRHEELPGNLLLLRICIN